MHNAEIIKLRAAWGAAPHDADLGYRLGAGLYEVGSFEEARQVWQVTSENTPDPDQLVRIARALQSINALDSASAAYDRALHYDPLHVDAHGYGAALAIRQDGLQASQDRLRKWASLSEDPVEAHFYLASLLVQEDAYAQAADHLQIALDLSPTHLAAQELLGIVLGKQGDHAGCVEAWRAARRLEPSSTQTAAGLGMALSRAGEHEEAIELLTQGVAGSGELCCLGRSLRETGALERGLQVLEQAVEVDDESGEAHAELGWTAFALEDYERAAAELGRASELSPREGQVHHRLGQALVQTGLMAQALAAYLKAAALLPDDQAVQKDLQKLQQRLRGAAIEDSDNADVEMTGQLDIVTLPNLLEFFTNNGTSGELVISAKGREAFVYLRGGRIHAAHATGCARLAQALMEAGDISRELLNDALGGLKEDLVAEAAFETGVVSEARLIAGMEHQIVQVLLQAVTWRSASFRFRRDPVRSKQAPTVHALDTRFALMEVMRLLDEAGATQD